jgi:2C-methyl-D-erythritol 2,4-cyclodiphosphate synthase
VAEDTDLAAFLKTQRQNGAACWCESAPKEITAQIDAVIIAAEASNVGPQWTAMARWLAKKLDIPLQKNSVEKHRDRGHVGR